jgi:hypothetical protein
MESKDATASAAEQCDSSPPLPGQPARIADSDHSLHDSEPSDHCDDDNPDLQRALVNSAHSDGCGSEAALILTRSKAAVDRLVADSSDGINPLPRWVAGWNNGWDADRKTGNFLKRTLVAEKPGDGTGKHAGEDAFIPFVATKAEQILIRGELDAEVATETLKPQGLFPILTRSGKAIGTININKINAWSHNDKYQEVVFALDAAKEQGVVIPEPCIARLGCCCFTKSLRRWDLGYSNFDTVVPGATIFVQSLFVSNSYACDASRQTQAFPKHPTILEPITMDRTEENPGALTISVKTSTGASVVEGKIRDRWPCCCGVVGGSGCCMVGRMACGFMCSFGLCPLLKLLCASTSCAHSLN